MFLDVSSMGKAPKTLDIVIPIIHPSSVFSSRQFPEQSPSNHFLSKQLKTQRNYNIIWDKEKLQILTLIN